jgi:hypothetical protein
MAAGGRRPRSPLALRSTRTAASIADPVAVVPLDVMRSSAASMASRSRVGLWSTRGTRLKARIPT